MIAAFFMSAAKILAVSDFHEELEPEPRQMVIHVAACDWGASIKKMVVNCGKHISAHNIKTEDFEINRKLRPSITNASVPRGELTPDRAYLSDSKGNEIFQASGEYLTLEFNISPSAENLNPFFSFNPKGSFKEYYGYEIENDELDLEIRRIKGYVNKNAAKFQKGQTSFTYEAGSLPAGKNKNESIPSKVDLEYCYYVPPLSEAGSNPAGAKKIPLVIWFHGVGDMGRNPYVALFGSKASNLAAETIQRHFPDGAAVIVPQCPMTWMETINEDSLGLRYWAPVDKNMVEGNIEDKIRKVKNNVIKHAGGLISVLVGEDIRSEKKEVARINKNISESSGVFAAVSYYTKPVKNLIDEFLRAHPEIDVSKIYVGGCSAGGYMTVNMTIQYPDFFAASFPVCEYYIDSKITDEQIAALAKKPLWFTYAINDEVVNPEKNSVATINRLKASGAKNLHVKEFEKVVDTSGKYFVKTDDSEKKDEADNKPAKTPYEYSGHSSWIYVLNDEVEADGQNLFDWLYAQKLD